MLSSLSDKVPRNCIGMRFATMEMKVFLASLLKQARIHPGSKSNYPPKFDKLSGMEKVSDGVWLSISKKSY
ncbi:putative cytochrome P450 [Armadillidium nasatum]|uniref:Putative cytochrome P450 n=1 Tax=Armadillidium nasatum TaxID=96803 RepID=A0A5N5SJF6_9CRUS|nr:putative cytochrome P450 [Armadillidium nasatum]